MKILLTLASSSMTGPAERMLDDAVFLRNAGHEVAVAFDTRTEGNLMAICRERGISTAPELALSRHSPPLEIARDVSRLRRRLRTGVALVHAHFSHDHHVALLASAGLRTRLVRSLEDADTGSALALRFTHAIEVPFAQLASSPRLSDHRAVAVVPTAVDPERFSPAPSKKLRDRLGVPEGAPLVGMVARMKPERHHRDLVEAFALARKLRPDAHLALIGRGEAQPALETLVRETGLGDSIHFAGYWSGADLVEAYRGLDVAVWLERGNDGGARGVLEAMSVGVPMVAYDRPPMDGYLADGAGRLVPAGNLARLADALVQAIDDGLPLGARGRERVLRDHTFANRGPALLALYDRASKS